ncbi:hypothetical protein K435DRAFT_794098 [Dendrothele bispora CBS 962.96]|uniref:Uncharacterized protein n=1 Tax=Dendrothele bispora (strain CBS 962.96) TaxID=1314807 RepID=A0A4S8MD83_DENBC|nr:hypothetical protein K435DRAFT_794098 [Dendrothele bispora CBS 962.96]
MSLPLLITNILATSLIGYKAWSHKKDIQLTIMLTGTTVSRVSKTLWLFIESGSLYCVIWKVSLKIAYIIVEQTRPQHNDITEATAEVTASTQFTCVMPLLAGLFPVLVILMAALGDAQLSNNNLASQSLHQSMQLASMNTHATGFSETNNLSDIGQQCDRLETGVHWSNFAQPSPLKVPLNCGHSAQSTAFTCLYNIGKYFSKSQILQ